VEKSKILLAHGGQSITDIALNCGFASSAYFANVFRQHVYCSPREFRDAAKNPR
jgi:AraC-like DNA-binding protein